MELGVRDWLIIVGVLLIVVVLFDGFRRMRNDRRGKIRMSLNKNFINSSGEYEEVSNTEIASGPRVVARSQHDADELADVQDEDLHLDEEVPMLMESITAEQVSDSELELDEPIQAAEVSDDLPEQIEEPEPLEDPWQEPVQQEIEAFREDTAETVAIDPADQEVIVINVMAKDGQFKGDELLQILLACDCRFGEMSIFHRYEGSGGKGAVQFSIVNSVEPGTFDLDNINSFNTPGVTFFVKVPGPKEPIKAFDYMVETAQCLVKNLNGELRDETHSVMTAQTLEHCRNRIREIERKQLTHA